MLPCFLNSTTLVLEMLTFKLHVHLYYNNLANNSMLVANLQEFHLKRPYRQQTAIL